MPTFIVWSRDSSLHRSAAGSSRGQNRFGHADGARTEFAVGRSTSVKMGASPVTSWSAAASVTALTVTRSITEAISAGIAALARMLIGGTYGCGCSTARVRLGVLVL